MKQPSVAEIEKDHAATGYGFLPRGEAHVIHYGDSSFSIDFFKSLDGWQLVGYETLLNDPYQLAVVLKPD